MENERDISLVANMSLDLVPEKECVLRESLQKFIDRLIYTPPEIIYSNAIWISFAAILNKFIPKITEDWHSKIQEIVNGVKIKQSKKTK